jgi:RimJ/RimL family protein N-acetyltransferase
VIVLRPLTRDDLVALAQVENDPDAVGEFAWFGFRSGPPSEQAKLLSDTGGHLGVITESGHFVGDVSWRQSLNGPPPNGLCWAIGIEILPAFRGRGFGTEAQRALADYLFAHTPAERIEASTEAGNVAEQKALERAGFVREGVLRKAVFRAGEYRDMVMYSTLREERDPA